MYLSEPSIRKRRDRIEGFSFTKILYEVNKDASRKPFFLNCLEELARVKTYFALNNTQSSRTPWASCFNIYWFLKTPDPTFKKNKKIQFISWLAELDLKTRVKEQALKCTIPCHFGDIFKCLCYAHVSYTSESCAEFTLKDRPGAIMHPQSFSSYGVYTCSQCIWYIANVQKIRC